MLMKRVMWLALVSACGDSAPEEAETSQSLSGSGSGREERGDRCDATPIDSRGTLPACVAGRSTNNGPGRPVGALLTQSELVETVQTDSVAASANALTHNRNPPSQDPVDRGFPPPPKKASQQ